MADAGSADVRSTEALMRFHRALVRFGEEVDSALAEAESEIGRLRMWLEREQPAALELEMRRVHDRLERAKEALRFKQNFKGPAGERQSVVDEQKMVKVLTGQMEELQLKYRNTKKHAATFDQAVSLYRGQVQGLATALASDVPGAVSALRQYVALLSEYASGGAEAKSEAIARPADEDRSANKEGG